MARRSRRSWNVLESRSPEPSSIRLATRLPTPGLSAGSWVAPPPKAYSIAISGTVASCTNQASMPPGEIRCWILAAACAGAAAKIQHLISPGGIEAWFVQDATVPLIAMEYAFGGGATQDPADKPGVGNLVASLIDEGSGDLDSKTFHERLDRRAIELSFTSTRDYFRGSLRMLKDNSCLLYTSDAADDLTRV